MKMTVSESEFQKKSTFALFAAYYRPNLRLLFLDMFCVFCVAAIDLSFPLATRYALTNFLPQKAYSSFYILIAIMFSVFLLRGLMQYVINYWGHIMGADIEMQMRSDLFAHLQKLSFSFYDNKRTGNLMSRILTDLFDITELSHHGPEDVFISILTLVGACISLMLINIQLALVLILALPALLLFTILMRKRMSYAAGNLKKRTAAINADIESTISGARVAKAFANEEYESDKFMRGSIIFRAARASFYRVMAVFSSGMEFMICMLNLISIGVGGYLIMTGKMTVIDLVAFNLYIAAFLTPIRKLTNFTELYQSGMAGFTRFIELMREEPDIIDKEKAVPLINSKGEVSFSHVSFSYNNDETSEQVLSDINLMIPAGKTIAVVGPSGSGKTTLCHLIPRFYEVKTGQIKIDGIDIRDLQIHSLRQSIGIVQQDVYLFATTIMENIRYGKLSATDSEVMEAAKAAELDKYISTLPDGYNTYVGERGLLLSGGQKQRISIARVFLKNPPILLLDEATSALDTQTELRIQLALERLTVGRTCLIIAHRLSTIRRADEIIYLGENGIEEQGSHDELIKKDGAYANLYRSQFGQ